MDCRTSRYAAMKSSFLLYRYCITQRGCGRGMISLNRLIPLFSFSRNFRFFPSPRQMALSLLMPSSSWFSKVDSMN